VISWIALAQEKDNTKRIQGTIDQRGQLSVVSGYLYCKLCNSQTGC